MSNRGLCVLNGGACWLKGLCLCSESEVAVTEATGSLQVQIFHGDRQTCCCSNILDTIIFLFPDTESGFGNMIPLVQPKHFTWGALTPHPSITRERACFMSHKIKQNPVLVVRAKSLSWLYLSDGKLHFLFSSPTTGTWISITQRLHRMIHVWASSLVTLSAPSVTCVSAVKIPPPPQTLTTQLNTTEVQCND